MTDYSNYDEALAALTDNKLKHDVKVDRMAEDEQRRYREGYARIAAFLNDTAAFEKALRTVSAKLWLAYNRDTSQSNKFTRALSRVAGDHGFHVRWNHLPTPHQSIPMQYKLVGADKQLGFFLRNKLFWKDCMDAVHGEHSHSLQWLAISAAGLGTDIPITSLYERSGEYKMDTKDGGKCFAWAWLADSFPNKSDGDKTALKETGDTLTTKSYRSPQNIMKHLLPGAKALDGHFVSNYLFRRYDKREILDHTAGKIRGQIKVAAEKKVKADTTMWSQSGRSPGRYIRQNFADKTKRTYDLDCKFHNSNGKMKVAY